MTYKIFFKWILPYLAIWAGLFLFQNAWLTLLFFHITILLILVIAQPNIPLSILFKSRDHKWILFNVLLGGLSGFGIYQLRNVFAISQDLPFQLAQIGLTTSTLPVFILYFSLVNPIIEEYYWRACLGNDSKGFHGSDPIYAGYHSLVLFNKVSVAANIFAFMCLTFAGWFWRQTKRENDGLLASVLGHMSADFSILMAVYFLIK